MKSVLQRKHLIAAAVILTLLAALWPAFDDRAARMDEATLLVYPELILKGQLPYRDFETFYGPANPYVLSAAYAIWRPSIFVERAVGLGYRLAILLGLCALLRRWGETMTIGGLLIAACLIVPVKLPAYAWLGGVMAALWSLYCLTNVDLARRCFLGGLLGGTALLFRVDLAPAVILAALPQFVAMTWTNRWRYIGGAALGLLPFAWLAAVAGPAQLFNNLFLFPVLISGPARRLPMLAAPLCVIILLVAHTVATLVNLAAGVFAVRADRQSNRPRVLLGLGLLGLGLTHQALQRSDLVHVLCSVFVSLALLPISLWTLWSRYSREPLRRRDELLVAACALLLLLALLPEIGLSLRQTVVTALSPQLEQPLFLRQRDRAFPLSPRALAVEAARMLNRLETEASPGQRLFVGPADLRRTNYADTWIYHMLPQLRPATYFLEMNPLSANRPGSRLAGDVASADWLVLNREWDYWHENNRSQQFGPEAAARVVGEKFELCGEYGPFELFRRRANAALETAQRAPRDKVL